MIADEPSATRNAAETIAHRLEVAILQGVYPPGAMLPTVRALAKENDVNPATAQRVIARLEATGLVEAKRGSGVRVLDPERAADLALLPAWLEAFSDRPSEAAALLADFLDVRRGIAARLLVRHRANILARAPELVRFAEALAQAGPLMARLEADVAFGRALLKATGSRAALAIFRTAERALRETPHLAEAMYGELEANEEAAREAFAALFDDADDAARGARIEAALARVDARTVEAFEARLRGAIR